ncbi:hypothetical protein D3C87_1965060 [compost metagenome]
MSTGTAVSGQINRSTGLELKLMSRYSASCALSCAGSHFMLCSTLPWIAATLNGAPAGLVQACSLSAMPATHGPISSSTPAAMKPLRAVFTKGNAL